MIPALLTPSDVADRLQVPRKTVLQWCRVGALPASKLGRHWRISASDLEAFVVARHTGVSTPLPRSEQPVSNLLQKPNCLRR